MATRTRTFGAGNRESHDASDFYARFTAPELSDDETVNPCRAADSIFCGDARDMQQIDGHMVVERCELLFRPLSYGLPYAFERK